MAKQDRDDFTARRPDRPRPPRLPPADEEDGPDIEQPTPPTPPGGSPGRILFSIILIVVAVGVSVAVRVGMREIAREARGLFIVIGAVVLGGVVLALLWWMGRSVRQAHAVGRPSLLVQALKVLAGIVIAGVFFVGFLRDDSILREIFGGDWGKSSIGVLTVGYRGYLASLLSGLGVGLGLGLMMHAFLIGLGRRAAWIGFGVAAFLGALASTFIGPPVSRSFYRAKEASTWETLTRRNSGPYEWSVDYFRWIPEEFHRPEARGVDLAAELDRYERGNLAADALARAIHAARQNKNPKSANVEARRTALAKLEAYADRPQPVADLGAFFVALAALADDEDLRRLKSRTADRLASMARISVADPALDRLAVQLATPPVAADADARRIVAAYREGKARPLKK